MGNVAMLLRVCGLNLHFFCQEEGFLESFFPHLLFLTSIKNVCCGHPHAGVLDSFFSPQHLMYTPDMVSTILVALQVSINLVINL